MTNLQGKKREAWCSFEPKKETTPQGRVIGSAVAFIGKVTPSIPYTHSLAPALAVASCLMERLTLHPVIREQGGAYGSGANHQPLSSLFTYYSYRDPHLSESLDAFYASMKKVEEGTFDEQALEEAILEVVQGLDSPVAPGGRGNLAYGWLLQGLTQDLREEFRQRLLKTKKEDVMQVVADELLTQYEKGATTIFAGESMLKNFNQKIEVIPL